jgi:hypothetical protein
LDLPFIGLDHCRDVVGLLHDVGTENPLDVNLVGVPTFEMRLGPHLDPPSPEHREPVARLLYLNAVLDQGPDSVGVAMLLVGVLRRLYIEHGIDIIRNPTEFFVHLADVIPLVEAVHAQVKEVRAPELPRLTNYSLYGDQYRVTPWVTWRWGSSLGNVMRFATSVGGLLPWLAQFPSGEAAAVAIKSDALYGLGGAIGEKASRLFVKWLLFTTRIGPGWPPNTYEVPLDANVGRVLMRTGYIFAFLDQEDMQRGNPRPWTEQPNGKVNLSAQAMNDRPLRRLEPIETDLRALLAAWGIGASRSHVRMMKTLNVILNQARGGAAAVGALDDGLMEIGRKFCHNEEPNCTECPMRNVCLANVAVPALKTRFYCGTGSNVFFR